MAIHIFEKHDPDAPVARKRDRRMRSRLYVLCALICVAGTARASTVWTGTNFQVDASAPIPVGTGLEAVTLTAVGLNGALPNSFDGVTGGATGITTAGNELHQVFEYAPLTGAPTPTLALNNSANVVYQPIDTHFLVQPPTIIAAPGFDPSEDQNVADAINPPGGNGGYGSFLTGDFALGVPLVDLTPTWDFAYIVVAPGTTVDLDFALADGAGNLPLEQVQTSFMVPEPASVCLSIIGMLVVGVARLARRHRRS